MKGSKINKDVLWFEVSMNVAQIMKFLNTLNHHLKDLVEIASISVVFKIITEVHLKRLELECNMVSPKINSFEMN